MNLSGSLARRPREVSRTRPRALGGLWNGGACSCIWQTLDTMELEIALVKTMRIFDTKLVYAEWDAGKLTVERSRAHRVELGGSSAHPTDGFPGGQAHK
ncbi:hypothetical protein F5Y15DRAFT_225430 [Xylariaceae sp. FL0016]|nr:hypothetical protein F5Y15DRAFT_225430 [Xylariaceae sp. FL0016]